MVALRKLWTTRVWSWMKIWMATAIWSAMSSVAELQPLVWPYSFSCPSEACVLKMGIQMDGLYYSHRRLRRRHPPRWLTHPRRILAPLAPLLLLLFLRRLKARTGQNWRLMLPSEPWLWKIQLFLAMVPWKVEETGPATSESHPMMENGPWMAYTGTVKNG